MIEITVTKASWRDYDQKALQAARLAESHAAAGRVVDARVAAAEADRLNRKANRALADGITD